MLGTYNNSCIPQMGTCYIGLLNKGIKYRFSVVPGNGPSITGDARLWMAKATDFELPSNRGSTKLQIMEQMMPR